MEEVEGVSGRERWSGRGRYRVGKSRGKWRKMELGGGGGGRSLVYLYDNAMLHPQWSLEESRHNFWTELYVGIYIESKDTGEMELAET